MSFWETNVVRNRTTTVIVDDGFVETSSFTNFRVVQSTFCCITLLVCLTILIYVLRSSRYVHRNDKQSKIFKYLLFHLGAAVICSFLMFLLSFIKISADSWQWCSFLASLPATLYVLAHAANYMIFLERSKIIELGNSSLMNALRLFTTLGTYFMLAFNCFMFVILRGILLPNNVCVQTFPWWLSILIAIADSALSLAFLIMFIYPLVQQANKMSAYGNVSSESSKKLKEVALKNLKWGSFTIATSFIFLVLTTTIRVLTEMHERSGERVYGFYLVDWTIGPLDLMANAIAACNITIVIWKPSKHRRLPRANTVNSLKSAKHAVVPLESLPSTGKSNTSDAV